MWMLVATLLWIVALAAPVAADGHLPGLIQVHAFSRGQGHTAQVVVTIRNMTIRPVRSLRIELWFDARLAAVEKRKVLAPKQSTVVQLATTTPEQSYVVVIAHSGKPPTKWP